MKNYIVLCALALTLSLFSCKEDAEPVPGKELKAYDVAGSAQKGPFINGSSVMIYDLDSDFKPTGRTFQVNTDATGHFELTGVKLSSDYVQIVADGFYYNEVSGDLSDERIMLKAFVNLTGKSVININVLTNLEYERIRYLMETQTLSYASARSQAQNEILKVFNMENLQVGDAESLDIAKTGEGDGVLLAVSAILQGSRTTAELSKLQADMIADLKEDGILNDTIVQGSLISHSNLLNLGKIKENVLKKYNELGIGMTQVNGFDQYVKNFNLHSTFHNTLLFEFPKETSKGLNVLDMDVHKALQNNTYSFAVKMPAVGKIKIRMKLTEGSIPWSYAPFNNYGWKVELYDYSKNEQTFTSTLNNDIIDLPIIFNDHGSALVEYFYNDSETPAQSKTITWQGNYSKDFEFKDSPLGINLLALNDTIIIRNGTGYVIGVNNADLYNVKFRLHYSSTAAVEVTGGSGSYSSHTIDQGIEIELKGNSGLSEIALKFKGTGNILIHSDLIQENDNYLSKVLMLSDQP